MKYSISFSLAALVGAVYAIPPPSSSGATYTGTWGCWPTTVTYTQPLPVSTGLPLGAQCGGYEHTGPTECAPGLICHPFHDHLAYYCVKPRNPPAPTPTATTVTATLTTTPLPAGTTTGNAPGATDSCWFYTVTPTSSSTVSVPTEGLAPLATQAPPSVFLALIVWFSTMQVFFFALEIILHTEALLNYSVLVAMSTRAENYDDHDASTYYANAPLTRRRATADSIPLLPTVAEYYSQRATKPGTLIITEATTVAHEGGGVLHVPGIYNDEQIRAWKEIGQAVHAKGSFIFSQLRAYGRAADPAVLASSSPPISLIGASPIPLSSRPEPRPRALTVEEIQNFVSAYAKAAKNTVDGANFDGVEIHAANGYLIDQFLQDVSNQREDEYGGDIQSRAKFALEVLEAVVKEVGEEKVGIRLSPWSTFLDMRMKDPKPTFKYLVTCIRDTYPKLAYIHVIEPRVHGNDVKPPSEEDDIEESNDFIRDIWGDRPLISAGGYTRETALRIAAERQYELVAFGRWFISNVSGAGYYIPCFVPGTEYWHMEA
ncbi:hypothetical protein ONZ45_g17870 [Pleurotus djamor]|nr:hypothetical protein ONZ45_g17870 [Pleurotus djamor]